MRVPLKRLKFFCPVLILLFSLQGSQAASHFKAWKQDYAKRAAKRGLSSQFVLSILSDIELDPKVVERDRNQVALNEELDYPQFIKKWMRESPSRIEEGRRLLQKHAKLLEQIEKKYAVEKEVIVAIWGVETFYGKITGDYDLVRSLATLAFEGRRRTFFETQLNATLRLLRDKHVVRDVLRGSWAGATGQCQFMPSNIPVYGQDFNADGKVDIWQTEADVFASVAYLLKRAGWKKGKSIGSLALNTQSKKLANNRYFTKNQYHRLGFRDLEGKPLGKVAWIRRRMSEIPLKNAPVVLRGSNYLPLMRWNNSSLFAAFNILLVEAFQNP